MQAVVEGQGLRGPRHSPIPIPESETNMAKKNTASNDATAGQTTSVNPLSEQDREWVRSVILNQLFETDEYRAWLRSEVANQVFHSEKGGYRDWLHREVLNSLFGRLAAILGGVGTLAIVLLGWMLSSQIADIENSVAQTAMERIEATEAELFAAVEGEKLDKRVRDSVGGLIVDNERIYELVARRADEKLKSQETLRKIDELVENQIRETDVLTKQIAEYLRSEMVTSFIREEVLANEEIREVVTKIVEQIVEEQLASQRESAEAEIKAARSEEAPE